MKAISFIISVKNVIPFVKELYTSLTELYEADWEAIFVDDSSEDGTYEFLLEIVKIDHRIRAFKNPGRGKVQALNYAYKQTKYNIIKSIDGDDVVLPSLAKKLLKQHEASDAIYHPLEICDSRLKMLSIYIPSRAFERYNTSKIVKNFISNPKACWSMSRGLADQIFPIPNDAPYEDTWISLLIKLKGKSIHYLNEPLYKYRQHTNQTFGNMYDYSEALVKFRASRNIEMIKFLKRNPIFSNLSTELDSAMIDYFYLVGDVSSIRYFLSARPLTKKAKNILMKRTPKYYSWLRIAINCIANTVRKRVLN